MKTKSLLWGMALVLTLGLRAHAEAPREEMAHAYRLLKDAKDDYGGHRVKAMEELHAAGVTLNLRMDGDAPERERQWKSNEKLGEARHVLQDARLKLEARDRDRVAARVDKAIEEIDLALKTVMEPPREELGHAYRLLMVANSDYAGHRAKAMEELRVAAQGLGLHFEGEPMAHERQWKSDEQMAEAHRLLQEARGRLEAEDRRRVASHVDKAIEEIDMSLRAR